MIQGMCEESNTLTARFDKGCNSDLGNLGGYREQEPCSSVAALIFESDKNLEG